MKANKRANVSRRSLPKKGVWGNRGQAPHKTLGTINDIVLDNGTMFENFCKEGAFFL